MTATILRGCDVRSKGFRNVTGCTTNHSTVALKRRAPRADAKISVILDMNWKSTALVSGAGLLVTWLANQPPRAVQVASARAPQAALAPASDIQQQAEHLRVRVRREVELSDPARNPF